MNAIIKTPIILLTLVSIAFTDLSAKEDSLYLDFLGIHPLKYILSFEDNNNGSNTMIKILDDQEHLLLRNSFNGNFKKIYNFEKLPDGGYTIIFENESNRLIQPLVLENGLASIEIAQQKIITYPSIEYRSKAIGVDLRKFNFEGNVKIIFQDLDQEFKEEYKLKLGRNHVYKLDNLPDGQYQVKLLIGEKIVNRLVTI